MKQIEVKGFTADIKPTDRPTVSVFGEEGSGKSRFAATMPDGDGDGAIGLLALDRKAKRTFEQIGKQFNKHVIVNKTDYLKPKDSIRLARLDGENKVELAEVKQVYGDLYQKILEDAMALADHPQIASIAVDSNTQFWDWIMFSHFGRKNQIETFQRGAPNQDMIDFINALKHKNLCLIHRASEIWKDTGEVDKQGRKKQAPSGKFKAEGCPKLGYLITCEIQMISTAKAANMEDKFKVRIRECQTNPLIEGEDMDEHGMSGEGISWDNLMTVIQWQD